MSQVQNSTNVSVENHLKGIVVSLKWKISLYTFQLYFAEACFKVTGRFRGPKCVHFRGEKNICHADTKTALKQTYFENSPPMPWHECSLFLGADPFCGNCTWCKSKPLLLMDSMLDQVTLMWWAHQSHFFLSDPYNCDIGIWYLSCRWYHPPNHCIKVNLPFVYKGTQRSK